MNLIDKLQDSLNNDIDNSIDNSIFDNYDVCTKPYFKPLSSNKKKSNQIKNHDNLVLWDYENIHFYNDFSIISRLINDHNSFKVLVYNKKNRTKSFTKNNVHFKLNKLKKRNWHFYETKNIADEKIINLYHKFKNKIKELILISVDKDFKPILDDAKKLGIKVTIIHNSDLNCWVNKYNYNIITV